MSDLISEGIQIKKWKSKKGSVGSSELSSKDYSVTRNLADKNYMDIKWGTRDVGIAYTMWNVYSESSNYTKDRLSFHCRANIENSSIKSSAVKSTYAHQEKKLV